jgi:hypothetical protein
MSAALTTPMIGTATYATRSAKTTQLSQVEPESWPLQLRTADAIGGEWARTARGLRRQIRTVLRTVVFRNHGGPEIPLS